MKIYADLIRPQFAVKGETHLFVKESGERFPHGTIGRDSSISGRRGMCRPSCNSHKYSQTLQLSSKLSGDDKRVVASHMKRKASTADRNYVLNLNARKAASAHNIMLSIIQGATDSPKSSPCKPSTSAAKAEESDSDAEDDIPLEELQRKRKMPTVPEKSGEASSCSSTSKPLSLTAEDRLVARCVFKDDI